MPELKQPPSLASLAIDLLVMSVVQFCDQRSSTGPPENVLQGMSVIKKDLHDRIPYRLLAGFTSRLLDAFNSGPDHPESSQKIALELIMDAEIDGLRCGGKTLRQLDHRDVHRLRGLVELDLDYFLPDVNTSLGNFRLNDLTKLIYRPGCTDLDLRVIRDNCPKLQELEIESSKITDKGLRLLGSCCELRVLDIKGNHCLTDTAVIDLISAGHTKLSELRLDNFQFLTHLDKRCPSMERLTINAGLLKIIRAAHLHSVAVNFPNLTHLGLIDSSVVDLTILKSLGKLEEINLDMVGIASDSEIGDFRQSLRELLTIIGGNIKTLSFDCSRTAFFIMQDGLNFIFESCPNIEYLKFDHRFENLIIPSFKKLKALSISIRIDFDSDVIRNVEVLRFPQLSSLEYLTLSHFAVSLECVKSIIVDKKNFPKLTTLRTDGLMVDEVHEIEQISKQNNLNFVIINRCYPVHPRTHIELV